MIDLTLAVIAIGIGVGIVVQLVILNNKLDELIRVTRSQWLVDHPGYKAKWRDTSTGALMVFNPKTERWEDAP